MSDLSCAEPYSAVRFVLDAEATPGLLSRLLQPFARRDLVPDRMSSHRSGDTLHVDIAVATMPVEAVAAVEGNLRQVVGVSTVTTLAVAALVRVA